MVTLHTTIHDCRVTLLPYTFESYVLVHPVRETPHRRIDLPKLHRRTRVILDCFFELVFEIPVVQEDIGVVKPTIEVSFDRLN